LLFGYNRRNGLPEKIASEILNKNADYLLAIKGNQKRLEQRFHDIFDVSYFQADDESNCYASQNKTHGRLERSLHMVNHDNGLLGDIALKWPTIKTLGYTVSFIQEREKPVTEPSVRYLSALRNIVQKYLHTQQESIGQLK
jgi:hypothetical protein